MITPEQREQRRHFIGSSDAAAIVGVDPYKSAVDIYLEKVNGTTDVTSEAAELGNWLERPLVEWCCEMLGVVGPQLDARFEKGCLAANADAFAPGLVIEAKYTSLEEEYGEEMTDHIPDRVIVQSVVHMYCADVDVVYVPVAIPSYKRLSRRLYKVERNEALLAAVVERCKAFYNEHVQPGVPPSGESPPSLDVLARIKRKAEEVSIDPELVRAFEAAKDRNSAAKSEVADAKAALIAALGNAEVASYGDSTSVYSYMPHSRESVPSRLLRSRYPDIYKELRTVSEVRTLRKVKR